jgi:hypothetical protein
MLSNVLGIPVKLSTYSCDCRSSAIRMPHEVQCLLPVGVSPAQLPSFSEPTLLFNFKILEYHCRSARAYAYELEVSSDLPMAPFD